MGLTVLVGIGLGMVMPPTQVTVQHAAGRESLGSAPASISLSRAVGGAVGVAIVGAILFAMIGGGEGQLTVRQVIEGGPAYIGQLSDSDRDALASRLAQAYRVVFLVTAGMTALGAALALTIPKPKWS